MIRGKATTQGTERYAERFSKTLPAGHFSQRQNWKISSIGFGTYLGEPDAETDRHYSEAVFRAIQSGCNLIDTAINYRFQRSERNVSVALQKAIDEGLIQREEIVLSTKGGFLSFDGDYPQNPSKYFHDEYISTGICKPEELAANCHCMSPAYLENQLDRSLKNLNLECVDVYFLHNPETQLGAVSRQEFMKRMLASFRFLERKVQEGKIQIYGTATWNGYREAETSPNFLSLEELIGLAREAGGEEHHFGAIQLPFNLAMPEAFLLKNQKFGPESVSLLEAANRQGFLVLCSASILQGRLASNLPDFLRAFFSQFSTEAQRAIQFVRSTPGVTSALVGMSKIEHVEENMKVASTEPVPWERMQQLFSQ